MRHPNAWADFQVAFSPSANGSVIGLALGGLAAQQSRPGYACTPFSGRIYH
ncbi:MULTISPECIES: hypothetical protein [Eikenella]|uniref:hypothetical protein n=1 Tax=Eikenella TaxID=538 RepID=UPI0012E966F8|nr:MULTISPECIES: hypothetical protein [Eikenella]